MDWLFRGGQVLTPEGFRRMDLGIRDGRFVLPEETVAPASVDADGLRITPGLVDTHLHGGLRFDCMDGPAALESISLHLASHGVTAWVPTAVAAEPEPLEAFLVSFSQARSEGARILGAHLESNFISASFRGAQPPEAVGAHLREIQGLVERYRKEIRILTLAPELPGILPFVRQLRDWGVQVSCGHSGASYEQVLAGVEAGIGRFTHLFNAQSPFRHREPGVAGAGLALPLYAELIADGYHVHPAVVRIAALCKGERLLLVSDALRGTGLPPGEYELGGRKTWVDGVARLEDGTIAGSVLTLERAVRNLADWADLPLEQAFRAASEHPARSLGLPFGRIERGRVADMALFDERFQCRQAFVGGALVHRA